MRQGSQSILRVMAATVGILALVELPITQPANADEVVDCNASGVDATAARGYSSIVGSRTITIMHLAMHDALNSIDRRYEPYVYEVRAEQSADPAAQSPRRRTMF